MKHKTHFRFVLLVSPFILISCGKKAENHGGACSKKAVTAFNHFWKQCNRGSTLRTFKEREDCHEAGQKFLNQFPNLDCVAEWTNSGENFNIRSSAIRESIENL